MSSPAIGWKLTLDGEKEYKDAISNINSALKTLDSEMKLTQTRFADNADSVEALTAKQDVLQRQMLTQKDKVEQLRAALVSAAQTYGESDAKTMRWQQSLNKAEAELISMQRELYKTTDALLDQQDAAERSSGGLVSFVKTLTGTKGEAVGLGEALSAVAGKLGINLPDGAAKALDGLNVVSAGMAAAVTGAAALVAAVAKVEEKLIDLTRTAAEGADEILTLSQTTGLSTQQIQEYQYASELLDVSLDTITGSLTKLTNNMQDTANGTGNAKAAFEQLGISVTDSSGRLRSAQDVFGEAIDKLGKVENATERDALAMDLFGKSAQDLNPLILQGSGALRALADEANETGYVMDELALDKLGAVDDAFRRLELTEQKVSNGIAERFSPYLTKALDGASSLIERVGDSFERSGIVDSFGSLLVTAETLLEPVGTLMEVVLPAVGPLLSTAAVPLAIVADLLNIILSALMGIVTMDFSRLKDAIQFNATQSAIDALASSAANIKNSAEAYGARVYDATALAYGGYDPSSFNYVDNSGNTYPAYSAEAQAQAERERLALARAEAAQYGIPDELLYSTDNVDTIQSAALIASQMGSSPEALAAAMRQAMDGMGVNLDGRRVGTIVTEQQSRDGRANG